MKEALVLLIGVGAGQVILLAISPLITRLYSPKDFGVFSMYMSIVGIIGPVIAGKYEYAVVVAEDEREAAILVVGSAILSIAIAIGMFLLLSIGAGEIGSLLSKTKRVEWLMLVPVGTLVYGWNMILNNWHNRMKTYRIMASSRVITASVAGTIQIGSAKLYGSIPSGLIVGRILGQACSVLYLLKSEVKKIYDTLAKGQIYQDIKVTLLKYIEFPKYLIHSTLLDNVGAQIPVLLIARLFNAQMVGWYGLAYRVLSMPVGLLSQSLGQVFYRRFNELKSRPVDAKRFLIMFWSGLALLSAGPLLLILFYGPAIFAYIFGHNWETAGRIASILAPQLWFMVISSPGSTSFYVLGLQKYSQYFSIAQVGYRTGSIFLGYLANDVFLGLKVMVIAHIIQTVIYNYIVWKKLEN